MLLFAGRMCYFGTTHEPAALFRDLEFAKPAHSSDVEWMLDLVNRHSGDHDAVDRSRSRHHTNAHQEIACCSQVFA